MLDELLAALENAQALARRLFEQRHRGRAS
jgi:hypothetical protein